MATSPKVKVTLKAGFILLFCALSYVETLAQKKCKFDFDKEDPISGERVRRNSYPIRKGGASVSYYRKKDEFKFECNMRFVGGRTNVVSTSDQLVIKLGNDDVLTVFPSSEYKPVFAGNMTVYAISYEGSRDQMEKIAENGVKHVRINIAGESFDVEVKSKMGEKMQEGAKCLLED